MLERSLYSHVELARFLSTRIRHLGVDGHVPLSPRNGCWLKLFLYGGRLPAAVSFSREDYRRADWVTASKLKHRESTIWQRRFWEHPIRDEYDFARHVDYIQFNPVKHGHGQRAVNWPHLTFHRYAHDGIYAHDWAVAMESAVLGYD